jgi:photosystem II stability/assembly factor-like uncharacterized protein
VLTAPSKAVFQAAALFALTAVAAAAVDPGTLMAEPAPLAPRSLLLDIARTGTRLVAVGERGHILLSDDGGTKWVQAERVPTQDLLTGVCFSDEKRGIAVGHDEVALVTQDSGRTWERTHYAPDAQQPLLDVTCASNGHAIAVGAYGAYFVSTDAGVTWTERKFDVRAPASAPKSAAAAADEYEEDLGDPHLNRIVAASATRLYIAAEAGHLYRSDDAGETWVELASPYEGSFFGVTAITEDIVLAYGLRGNLFRSNDAGSSWHKIETNTVAMLNDAVVLEKGSIAVLGLSGVVLLHREGGERYELTQQADRKGLSAAVGNGVDSLVTVGEAGVKIITLGGGT